MERFGINFIDELYI
jgi:hypothetical protein